MCPPGGRQTAPDTVAAAHLVLDYLVIVETEVDQLVVDHLEGALVQLRDGLVLPGRVQNHMLLVHLREEALFLFNLIEYLSNT